MTRQLRHSMFSSYSIDDDILNDKMNELEAHMVRTKTWSTGLSIGLEVSISPFLIRFISKKI